MPSIPALAELVPRALFFHGDAYLEMSSRPRAARDGAHLLLVLGLALGVAGAVQGIIGWAASPDVVGICRVLARGLAAVPAIRRLEASAPLLGALRGLGMQAPAVAGSAGPEWLRLAVRWLSPTPLVALGRLALDPVGLILGWLGYGLLAHLVARGLGGRGRLGPTLGCTALAEAPCLLLLWPLLPPLGLAGAGIWAWRLAARYQALRTAHRLDAWQAFWAALLPALAPVALGALVLGSALLAWSGATP